MPHFDWKTLGLLFLVMGCSNHQDPDNQLIVQINEVSLRASPSEKSPEIATLSKGSLLIDLQEVGPTESQVTAGGQLYQTPWIKVRSADQKTGWILAWALRPQRQQADWLFQKRIQCYFGKPLAERRNTLVQDFESLQTERQMAVLWQSSTSLRDTFLFLLSRRPESVNRASLSWMDEALPGFLLQKATEGVPVELFADFKIWQAKALQTQGVQDDAFFQTCLAAFSRDSIESRFPAWKFQLSETESASQLGTGVHLKMLLQVDQTLVTGTLFEPALQRIKDQVLEDIFDKNVQYWQSKARILEELTQITTAAPKCLDARTLEALQIRRKMFEDPEANGVRVNLRSGE